MPTYPDLPVAEYYPAPERFFWNIHRKLDIHSILDVGAGHGGVFDCFYWTHRDEMVKREACDIFKVRNLPPGWTVKNGVDVTRPLEHYEPASFDLVQCTEVLEHVHDTRKALENLVAVARKLVFVTSADETHHEGEPQARIQAINPAQAYIRQPSVADLRELGFQVYVDNERGRQLIAWLIK